MAFKPNQWIHCQKTISECFKEALVVKPTFTYPGTHKATIAGDIATHTANWAMNAILPSGQAIQESGGLVNKQALCHCSKKLHGTCKRGCVDPSKLRFTSKDQINFIDVEKRLSDTTDPLKTLLSQLPIQAFESPASLSHILKHTLEQTKSYYQQSLN
ncbi:hypothetical protein [Pseudoalteromonas umbrosa]|uniref:hypothetical protein n=1 Tax=Pseudoalteromonas umbrosa TaxID=3048489 RepID=UPI0024C33E42|nr:hypothetical protein [Pseudoalteromonas sp. B95]MDK1285983.1 hypothetical protein [Pseudoalteromonas sp. B95]